MGNVDYDVIAAIERTDFLPPYFAVAQKSLRLLSNKDLQFRELASVLETDQALVSKVLGLVNSVFYGLPRQITHIVEALSFLGLEETRNLVMAVSTKEAFTNRSGQSTWRHSLTCAYMAEALAKYSRQGVDQNQAFTAGLVHDIGIAFVDKKMLGASDEIRIKMDLGRPRLEAERSVLGMDHTEVGQIILRRWNVPDIIVQAIRYHHSPWKTDNPLCKIVALANEVAVLDQEGTLNLDERLVAFARISIEDLHSLYSATQVTIANFESKISSI